jgi:hypothetical protein
MVTRAELTELLADIKVIHYQINSIVYNKNPFLKIEKCAEVRQLETLLNDKFKELSSSCSDGKKHFYY